MFGIDDAAIATGGAAAASALSNWFGQQQANASNKDMNRENNAFNMARQHEQMAFNLATMRENLGWQEKMSNSAYQRRSEDLKKAGLNPILAVGSGPAGTGSGGQASSGVASSSSAAPQQNRFSGLASSAMDALRLRSELNNLSATTDKIKSDTALNEALRKSAIEQAKLHTNNAKVAGINSQLIGSQVPGAKVESDIDKSRYGQIVRYLGRLNPFGHSAKAVSAIFK